MVSFARLPGFDFREIEDVVDDAEKCWAGALDLEHVITLARRELSLKGRGARGR